MYVSFAGHKSGKKRIEMTRVQPPRTPANIKVLAEAGVLGILVGLLELHSIPALACLLERWRP